MTFAGKHLFAFTVLIKSTLNAGSILSFLNSSKTVILTPGHFYRGAILGPCAARRAHLGPVCTLCTLLVCTHCTF